MLFAVVVVVVVVVVGKDIGKGYGRDVVLWRERMADCVYLCCCAVGWSGRGLGEVWLLLVEVAVLGLVKR